ncbi:hypothetical protein BKA63DRAFT_517 [Paraphoma chrysanthemicola]|nr:hypothetical protein BKA63DRAFT_517 [Paraphoma chrysanthemicola]
MPALCFSSRTMIDPALWSAFRRSLIRCAAVVALFYKPCFRQAISAIVMHSNFSSLHDYPYYDNTTSIPSLARRAELPAHLRSLWTSFVLGVILGAATMSSSEVNHRLRWLLRSSATLIPQVGLAKPALAGNVSDDTICGIQQNIMDSGPAITTNSSTGGTWSPPDGASETMSPAAVSHEILDTGLVNHDSDVARPSWDEVDIELEDLDQLQEYIYGPTLSTDDIMRPIHDIFAPELEYKSMKPIHERFGYISASCRESREVVPQLQRLLGRFAIRQHNPKLLERTYFKSQERVKRDLWPLLEVAVEYNRSECFEYILPCVEKAEERTRVLDMCADRNRVNMMAKAFSLWTTYVKTDSANTPLVVAAARGHIDSVRFLLTKCTDVEVCAKSTFIDERYPTPILAATVGNHRAILAELLAAGAKLEEDHYVIALDAKNANMLACIMNATTAPIHFSPDLLQRCLELAIEAGVGPADIRLWHKIRQY